MTKLKGLSLFSNVGIAEACFKSIGIDLCVANEIDKVRARFYQEVYPETHMICGDEVGKLYNFDDVELCIYCIEKRLEKVE